MKKYKQLNTDPAVVKKLVFDLKHKDYLTPALIYIWNAETDELEDFAEEILGRMAPDFIGRYIRGDLNSFKYDLYLLGEEVLHLAFHELCNRSDHQSLRNMQTHIQLLLNGPCTEECDDECFED